MFFKYTKIWGKAGGVLLYWLQMFRYLFPVSFYLLRMLFNWLSADGEW